MWLSAASRAEAERLLRDERRRRARDVVPTTHTVGSYMTDWLMAGEFGPHTFDRYRAHLRERILPTLGDIPLDELTPPKVRQALASWKGAAATRAGTLIVLRSGMRQAVSDRMRDSDPTAGVKAPTLPQASPTVLDVDEARHLMDTVKGERFAPILAVALGLGLRRGEVLGLRTADLDLPRTLTVSKQLRRIPTSTRADGDGWWRLTDPKAGSGRTIPLPAFVAEALAQRVEERDAEARAARTYAYNDLVFADLHGNPVAFASLDRWFKDALSRAGLPAMRFHGLRASTATILLAEGVPDITVMQILGHKNLQMTTRYVKLIPRVSRAAAERLDEVIG